MASSVPFSVDGALHYPPDAGEPIADRPFSVSGNFNQKVEYKLKLTGSGTHVVNMGTITAPGAKAVVIEVENEVGASPIIVKYNGASAGKEISPGGFDAYCNPAPAAGVTAISIEHASAVAVSVWVLG